MVDPPPLDDGAFSHLPTSVLQVVAQRVHADAPRDGALLALALVCKAARNAASATLAERPLHPRRTDVAGALADVLLESADAPWPRRGLAVCLEPHPFTCSSTGWFRAALEPPAWTRSAVVDHRPLELVGSRADLVAQLRQVESVGDGSASFVLLLRADGDPAYDVRWRSLAVLEGRLACAAAAAAMRALGSGGSAAATPGAMLLLAATSAARYAVLEASARQAAAALVAALAAAAADSSLVGCAAATTEEQPVVEISAGAAYWHGRVDLYRMGHDDDGRRPSWQHGVRVGHTRIYVTGSAAARRQCVRMDARGKVVATGSGEAAASPQCAASAARAHALLERVRVPAIACIRAMARVVEVRAARQALAAHRRVEH